MPAYSRLVGPLCLLACLLTAAASGDDFCLLRLLCPATAAAADPLPLDDPNTDFLSAAKSGAGHRSDGGAGGDGSPAGVRCLEIVERQVHNMGRLINDLLDAARLEQGKLRLNPETVDLTTAVAQVVETARPVVEARRHRLTTDLPAGPLHVQADPTRLAQIVMNLLTNAARYTQPGGQITVVLERVAGEAVLRVRDSGVGIPPEKLEEVFAPFVQVGEGAADGLGVGLSLARGLARLHGGDIRARSDGPGQGSEFVVCLPLPPDEATVIELVRKPPRPA